MKVLVPIKRVVDYNVKVRAKADETGPDLANAKMAILPFCEIAVEEAVRYSERSRSKCIGITIETRPDYCLKKHISDMLNYGCTRLEIGVQSVYEDVARDTNRGHTVRAVSESFHMGKGKFLI